MRSRALLKNLWRLILIALPIAQAVSYAQTTRPVNEEVEKRRFEIVDDAANERECLMAGLCPAKGEE